MSRRVGRINSISPASSAATASRGRSHSQLTSSRSSCDATCPSGATATKNRVFYSLLSMLSQVGPNRSKPSTVASLVRAGRTSVAEAMRIGQDDDTLE